MAEKNKILLVPDSFKGTMSSSEICAIMKRSIESFLPQAEIVSIPVADGGEGTVDAMLEAVGGEKIEVDVQGPRGENVRGFYGSLPGGEIAIIEMAAAAGLPLMGDNLAVMETTTYGVGQLIEHALDRGHREIIIGLGGSATNDGGAGTCAALGVRFLDKDGNSFVPVGATLKDIETVDVANIHPGIKEVSIKIMCDIDNPLCGEQGAAAVFGPQKGADEEMVRLLDEGLANFAKRIREALEIDILNLPGAGAAGGMGGGLHALLGGKLEMGIDVVLDTVKFDRLLQESSLVFSGEGRIDSQSLRGKVVIGVARRSVQQKVPLIAVVGDIADDMTQAYEMGVSAVVSINRVAVPFKEAKPRAQSDLALTMDEIMRQMRLGQNLGLTIDRQKA